MANPLACRDEFVNDRDFDEEDRYDDGQSTEDENESDEEYRRGRGKNSRIESKKNQRISENESDSDSDSDSNDDNDEESQKKYKGRAVPESKVNWNSTHVTFKISGSLNEFAKNSKKCCDSISENAKGIFESTKLEQKQENSDISNGNKSDIKLKNRTTNHMCVGLSLTKVESSFPCSLALNIEGINIPNESKTFTSDGNSGSFIVTPKMNYNSQEGIPLNQKCRDTDSPFIKNFPGWNLGNIHEGITHLDKKMSMISDKHPVVVIFDSIRMSRGESPLNEENQPIPGFYHASRKDTEKCLQTIKDKMQKHLKIQDLYKMKVSISRAFTEKISSINGIKKNSSWLDATEIYDNINGENAKKREADEKHNLYVTFKVEYMNV